ncbi:hypothetical protein RGQ29_032793 [Quercus rubra]|uniref:Cyclic nucleotide-binding domain-containing protein n=1 Tax=Quercus rubra TaxID=3512 RepID=A0AAN7DUS4_QUERU|nr:hypothetical protein RGQ29_032793 [Quercus rubra]
MAVAVVVMGSCGCGSGGCNNHDIEWQLPKNGGGDAVQEVTTTTTTSKTYILDPREKFLQGWNVVFVLSCVTAVALDPLFFYLPVIIQDKKCIWFDNRLWITVLVLRSFFDFIYLVHIILQFRTGFIDKKLLKSGKPELNTNARKIAKKYLWPRLIFDILAILPIPQVLGAFWYFFSSQRLAACWHIACENHAECVGSSFKCDQNFGNHYFIDDICPIKTENTTSFNFGIFLEALRSGVLDSTDFPQKLFYSFWWGMRNLSSLGQNLQTSNYIWENCFALCISIFGMILFLYFLGNLQWTTSKSIKKWEKKRMKMKSSKRQKQQKNLKSWISKHEFHGTTKGSINDYIGQRYEADEDVYVKTLIPDLPSELQSDVKRHICLDLLKNMSFITFVNLQEPLLLKICDSLKPVFFNEHHYIVREGDPIDAVFLITEGIVWTCTSNNGEGSGPRHAERLEKGQYFGGKLLEWVLTPTSDDMYNLSKLPISSKTLKTHTKVEAFALMAHDLKQIWHSKLSRLGQEQLQSKAAARVQRVWRRNHPKTDDSNSVGGGSRKLQNPAKPDSTIVTKQ